MLVFESSSLRSALESGIATEARAGAGISIRDAPFAEAVTALYSEACCRQGARPAIRFLRDFLDWTQVISWIRTTCEWSPAEPFGDDSYASFFFAASLRALTPR